MIGDYRTMYCKKCGAEIQDEDRFCKKCGNPTQDIPKKKRKKGIIIGGCAGGIVLVVTGILFATGIIGSRSEVAPTNNNTVVQQVSPGVTGQAVSGNPVEGTETGNQKEKAGQEKQETDKYSANEQSADITISSAEELVEFSEELAAENGYGGKRIILTCDIQFNETMNAAFEPIGFWEDFTGTFDGCGHTISGIGISKGRDLICVGLFSTIGKDGVVKNVTLKDCSFEPTTNNNESGGIAGKNLGVIDNCHNRGTEAYAGISAINEGTIVNCSSTGRIIGYTAAGGIAGVNKGYIYNCYNTGNVSLGDGGLENHELIAAGGIVGKNEKGGVINCYTTGNVTAIGAPCGGIVGISGSDATVSKSYCSSESADKRLGYNEGHESDCEILDKKDMATETFRDQLNQNCGTNEGWKKWELRTEDGVLYPQHVK